MEFSLSKLSTKLDDPCDYSLGCGSPITWDPVTWYPELKEFAHNPKAIKVLMPMLQSGWGWAGWEWDIRILNERHESRRRTIQRTQLFRDELREYVHSPARIQKLLDNGITIEELE